MRKDNQFDFSKPLLVLIAYIILLFGYIFTKGFYSFGSAVLILVSLFLLLVLVLDIKIEFPRRVRKKEFELFLLITTFISIILSLILYGGLYQKILPLVSISKILSAAAVLLGLMSFFKRPLSRFGSFFL